MSIDRGLVGLHGGILRRLVRHLPALHLDLQLGSVLLGVFLGALHLPLPGPAELRLELEHLALLLGQPGVSSGHTLLQRADLDLQVLLVLGQVPHLSARLLGAARAPASLGLELGKLGVLVSDARRQVRKPLFRDLQLAAHHALWRGGRRRGGGSQ